MGYVKAIQSGNLLEIFEYEKSLPIRRKKRRKDSYRKQRDKNRPRNSASIQRARASFKRLVRANLIGGQNPALFTFTMFEKLSYSASCRLFTRFISRLGRGRDSEFRYLAVPEFQKRGAVHWHVLIWGLPEHYACQGTWKKRGNRWVFQHECPAGRQCERRTRRISRLWLRGFVDGVVTDGSPRLATYLTKYLQKSMHDKRSSNKKTYYASHNILRPMHVESDSEFVKELLREQVIPSYPHLTERTYDTEWLGKVVYKQYETSYDCKAAERNLAEGDPQVREREEDW